MLRYTYLLLIYTVAAQAINASKLWHRNAPGASSSNIKTQTSNQTSASTTYSAAPVSVASGGPLVLAKQLLNQSSTDCKAEGGGCAVFNITVMTCPNDAIVCRNDFTLAGMICAQCNASQDSIDTYNKYLEACALYGLASPSGTLSVPISTTAMSARPSGSERPSAQTNQSQSEQSPPRSSNGPAVGLLTAMPSASTSQMSASGSHAIPAFSSSVPVASSSSTASPRILAAFEHESESDVRGSSLTPSPPARQSSSMISIDDSTVSLNPAVGLDLGNKSSLVTSVVVTNVSKTSIISSSPSLDISLSALPRPSPEVVMNSALNATIAFFGYEIDEKCEKDCRMWKGLASSCKLDQCICVEAGVSSAAACSECVGTTTHGESYQQQVGYYNVYSGNCSDIAVSASDSPHMSGYDIVAAAATIAPSDQSLRPRPSNTKAAQEVVVTETKPSRAQRLRITRSYLAAGIISITYLAIL